MRKRKREKGTFASKVRGYERLSFIKTNLFLFSAPNRVQLIKKMWKMVAKEGLVIKNHVYGLNLWDIGILCLGKQKNWKENVERRTLNKLRKVEIFLKTEVSVFWGYDSWNENFKKMLRDVFRLRNLRLKMKEIYFAFSFWVSK